MGSDSLAFPYCWGDMDSIHYSCQFTYDNDNASQQKTNTKVITVLILLILVASLFRVYNLGEHSFWFDEVASIRNTMAILQLPPYEDWGLLGMLKNERVPPLYSFYIMPFYCLSPNEWVLRFAAVVWSIATVPLIYRFGARLFNKKVGLIGALLLTFSPFHISYSREVRHYSLFLFLSISLFCLSYRALAHNKNIYYIGMIIVSVLGLYTHTYVVFPLFIVNLYFIFGWKEYHHLLRKWLLTHLTIVILCIPALYHVVYHIMVTGRTQLAGFSPGLRSLIGTFYLFTMGRVFFPTKSNLVFIVIQGAIWGAGLLVGIWALWRERAKESGRHTWSFFLTVAITYTAIWLISLSIIPLFDEARVKYLIFLLPIYYLLVAKGWVYLSNTALKTTLVSLAVLISLISIYPLYFQWDQVGKGNFRAAAEYIQRNSEENDVVCHMTAVSALPIEYYLGWRVPQKGIASDPACTNSDGIWLVVFNTNWDDFVVQPSQKQQISAQEQQNNAASACTAYIKDESLHLADLQIFPGRSELTVCLYRRETPDSFNLR